MARAQVRTPAAPSSKLARRALPSPHDSENTENPILTARRRGWEGKIDHSPGCFACSFLVAWLYNRFQFFLAEGSTMSETGVQTLVQSSPSPAAHPSSGRGASAARV